GKLHYDIFRYAMIGYYNMKCEGLIGHEGLVTIIDFSQSSNNKRLFVIDIEKHRLDYNTLVAHGINTGNEMAERFSNRGGSGMSSYGFYTTAETYDGRHEYSLKIDGLEPSNSNVRSRGVVFHGAEYVSEEYTHHSGRIGRSNGCPAIPEEINRELVDHIKNGSCVFMFTNNEKYLVTSRFLDFEKALQQYYGEHMTGAEVQ
ncbi:MAG: murein L,D-transpeptidase catalytic domain family protein, partial [Bacteroidota bacterium]